MFRIKEKKKVKGVLRALNIKKNTLFFDGRSERNTKSFCFQGAKH